MRLYYNQHRYVSLMYYTRSIPLTMCTTIHCCAMLQMAIEHGMSIEYSHGGFTMLEAAVRRKQSNVAVMLISYGANIHAGREYPLRHSIYNNDDHLVSLLIAAGADVNLAPFGEAPLDDALQRGSHHVVSMLLSAGAHMTNSTCGIARVMRVDRDAKLKLLHNHGYK